MPLVADVRQSECGVQAAAETCESAHKSGNFVDVRRTFKNLNSPMRNTRRLKKIHATHLCRFLMQGALHSRASQVNHGSLSDGIMSRYGDTPAGMVESVMEFLRVCSDEDFSNIVISIKASNVVVMVETVRMLAGKMNEGGYLSRLHHLA